MFFARNFKLQVLEPLNFFNLHNFKLILSFHDISNHQVRSKWFSIAKVSQKIVGYAFKKLFMFHLFSSFFLDLFNFSYLYIYNKNCIEWNSTLSDVSTSTFIVKSRYRKPKRFPEKIAVQSPPRFPSTSFIFCTFFYTLFFIPFFLIHFSFYFSHSCYSSTIRTFSMANFKKYIASYWILQT